MPAHDGDTSAHEGKQTHRPSYGIAVLIVVTLAIACACACAYTTRRWLQLRAVVARVGTALDDRRPAAAPRGGVLRRNDAAALLRPRTLAERRAEVDALLERAQALHEFGDDESLLARACSSALAGGKRLRAVIVLEVARMANLSRRAAARAAGARPPAPADPAEVALFIEYLHAASLAVDDLPEFDDDAVRRGRPSLHAEVGPAAAKLAAVALVAASMQNMGRQLDWLREHCPEIENVDRIGTRLFSDVGRAMGVLGAAGGQCMELAGTAPAGPEIAYMKTATFFELAALAGWMVAGGAAAGVPDVRALGGHVGTAFQIADDIGDMAADAARAAAGKPGWNYANTHGLGAALTAMEAHLASASALLHKRQLWSPLWGEIYGGVRGMLGPAGATRLPAPAPAPAPVPAPASEPTPVSEPAPATPSAAPTPQSSPSINDVD
jgi:geranylgeranyl diphosphate synthase type II